MKAVLLGLTVVGAGMLSAGAPAAAADLKPGQPGPVFITPADPVARRSVPLEVADPNGVARENWPVRGGVPIPRGELRDAGKVRLLDAAGREVPVQTEVLGWWPTVDRPYRKVPASVMWLCVTFLADVPAGGKATFTLEYGTNVTPTARPANPVKVSKGPGEAVTLDNGLVSVRLGKKAKFIERIALAGRKVVADGGTEMTTDVSCKTGTMDRPPVVALPAQAEAPKIDGKLDDAVWAKARKVELGRFRLAGKPAYPTEARMYLDKEFLYIALDCRDDDPAGIQAPRRKRDAYEIRHDDRVEIWLDPAATIRVDPRRRYFCGYVEISISASGTVRDRVFAYGMPITKWMKFKRRQRVTGLELDLKGLKTATRRTETGWQGELAIPLDEARLNHSWTGKTRWNYSRHSLANNVRHKNTFGVQIYRHRPARPGRSGGEESRWPLSLSYADLRPGKFARIPDPAAAAGDFDPLAAAMTKAKVRSARVEVRDVTVEVAGPVVSIARVRGWYHHEKGYGSPFTVRVHLYAGRKDLRLFHTMTTGFRAYCERMRSVSLALPCDATGRWTAGVAGGEALEGKTGVELVQYRDDSYVAYGGKAPLRATGRLSGWFRAGAESPLTVAVRDFWELYPGGCGVSAKGMRVDFYSPRARPVYFGTPGEARDIYGSYPSAPDDQPHRVSRTHEVWIDLSGGDSAKYGKATRRRLLPWAGRQWNCDSLGMGFLAAYNRKLFGRLEDWTDYQLWWFVNDQRKDKWYGWGIFGNTPNTFTGRGVPRGHPNAYEVGYVFEGGYGWANDRKGVSAAYLIQYFRSGRRIWFDFGEGSARCGTDICTTYPTLYDMRPWPERKKLPAEVGCRELPYRAICCPRRHWQTAWFSNFGSAARQGGQPGWVLFYFLTGDRRVRDVIEMHGRFITNRGRSNSKGGGLCMSSPHGTRAMERRHLLHLWIITDNPLYAELIDGFHRKTYAKVPTENRAVIALRYPWYVKPENAWMWARRSNTAPPEVDLSKGGIRGMHVELGGWEAPARYYEITGDPWLAKVLFRLSGPEPPRPEPGGRYRRPNWTAIYASSYGAPVQRYADMLRWTGNPGYLRQLTGYPSVGHLAASREVKSPVPPAEPEKPMERRKLYEQMMQFTFGAPPVFPAGYLWPTNNYYMGYALYPLQKLIGSAGAAPEKK